MEKLSEGIMLNITTLISGFLFASALLSIFISVYAVTIKRPYAKTLSLLCLANTIYSIGYAMEIYSTTFSQMLFWNLFQYIAIPFLPALWIILALQYNNKEHLLNPYTRLGIFTVPVITLILRYTSNINHLFYARVEYSTNNFIPMLHIDKGPWYLINSMFVSFCIIYANYLYWLQYRKSVEPIRRQCIMMLAASLLPWLSSILNLLNISPFGLDLYPFIATTSSVLFLLALFKYKFLNIKPLARDMFFSCTNDGIIVLDVNYNIIDFNSSAVSIYPALDKNTMNRNIGLVLGVNDKAVESIINCTETQYKSADGHTTKSYSIKTAIIPGPKNQTLGFIATITDITTYVDIMDKLNHLASIDELTGVCNRRYFAELSSRELARARRYKHPVCLIILDFDFFKNINDHYGHQAGDAVLQAVADICYKSVRPTDIIGRWGGEEFVILLPETRMEECNIVSKRILTNIETLQIIYEGNHLKTTVSIGIAGVCYVADDNMDYLLKHADQALYQAKSAGRNCIRSIEIDSHSYQPVRF